jgi:outer membrane lipoprotein-sorting protein
MYQRCIARRINRLSIVGVAGLVLAAGLLPGSVSWAYVLEGPHLLDLMTHTKSKTQTLQVEQRVIIEDQSLSNQPIELEEILRFSFPDTFRSDTQYEQTHRVLVVASDQALTVVDGQIVSNQQGRFDRYKDLLLYRTRYLLHRALIAQHVDVGQTSLGRWDDHIVVVIGAQYPDESVSQLWVDKELFLPMRWIIVPQDPDDAEAEKTSRLEFIYRDWRKMNGVWYPMQIETTLNQQRIRLVRVKTVQSNVVMDAELFNISHLMTLYAPAESEEPLPRPESDLDEVERTIEDFRKKFEP